MEAAEEEEFKKDFTKFSKLGEMTSKDLVLYFKSRDLKVNEVRSQKLIKKVNPRGNGKINLVQFMKLLDKYEEEEYDKFLNEHEMN